MLAQHSPDHHPRKALPGQLFYSFQHTHTHSLNSCPSAVNNHPYRVIYRKKSLKPPGAPTHKPKPKSKAPSSAGMSAAPADGDDEDGSSDDEITPEEAAAAAEARRLEAQLAAEKFDAPSLRRSTMSRVAEAQKERKVKEKVSQHNLIKYNIIIQRIDHFDCNTLSSQQGRFVRIDQCRQYDAKA